MCATLSRATKQQFQSLLLYHSNYRAFTFADHNNIYYKRKYTAALQKQRQVS